MSLYYSCVARNTRVLKQNSARTACALMLLVNLHLRPILLENSRSNTQKVSKKLSTTTAAEKSYRTVLLFFSIKELRPQQEEGKRQEVTASANLPLARSARTLQHHHFHFQGKQKDQTEALRPTVFVRSNSNKSVQRQAALR